MKVWPTTPGYQRQLRFGADRINGLVIPRRNPTRVRWGILQRTDMDFTTWRGMCMSGVGIGMGRRMVNQLLIIQQARQQGAAVFCAAAIGWLRRLYAVRRSQPLPPVAHRKQRWVPLCEGALVSALTRAALSTCGRAKKQIPISQIPISKGDVEFDRGQDRGTGAGPSKTLAGADQLRGGIR